MTTPILSLTACAGLIGLKMTKVITGDELIDFVNNTLFKTFKDWQLTEASDPKAVLVKSLFEDSYNYMKSGTLMRSVIN